MKKITVVQIILISLLSAQVQKAAAQSVGINFSGAKPYTAAILDLNAGSTGKQGLLIPRMSDIERQNINNPVAGLMIYDTTLQVLALFDGTNWQGLSAYQVSSGAGTGTSAYPGVAINTTGAVPNASAVLDVSSTTKGMLIPRVNTTGSVSNDTGMIIYNKSLDSISVFNGSAWTTQCETEIDNTTGNGTNTPQGVAINKTGAVADPSAMLDVSSSNQGLIIPRITSTERAHLPSPARGLLIYCTDDGDIEYWTGTGWNALACGWVLLNPTVPVGGPPAGREGQVAVWDSVDGTMLMFGGDDGNGDEFNDLWSYTPSTNTWAQLIANGASGSPDARSAASAVWDDADKEMILFSGGYCGGSNPWYNDVWGYKPSNNTWTQFNPNPANLPTTRYGSSAVWDATDKIMLIYAGAGNPHQDLWSYKPSTDTWTQLSTATGPNFARDTYQAVWDPTDHLMWIFEGNLYGTIYNDTWSYSPSTATWTQYSPVASPSDPRAYYSAVWNPATKSVIMFAGWDWNNLYNDIWSYSPSANTWTQVNVGGSIPAPRGAHTAVMDLTNNIMYIYAGSIDYPEQCSPSTVMDDVWQH